MGLNNKDLEVGYYQCKDLSNYVTKMLLKSDSLFKLSTYRMAPNFRSTKFS